MTEGVLRMILDSGEERSLHRGEIAGQHSAPHRWVNVTEDGLLPARILVVQLNMNNSHIELGLAGRNSICLPGLQTDDGPDRGKFAVPRK